LTITNSRIEANTVTVDVYCSDANGPSGPAALEADANATIDGTLIDRNAVTVTHQPATRQRSERSASSSAARSPRR
jgi:hypothetical protein